MNNWIKYLVNMKEMVVWLDFSMCDRKKGSNKEEELHPGQLNKGIPWLIQKTTKMVRVQQQQRQQPLKQRYE